MTIKRYEAMAFIEETHDLLTAAAEGELTSEQEARALELEAEAVRMLSRELPSMRIVLNDGVGPNEDPKHPAYNTLEPVASIEKMPKEKIIEWPSGDLEKIKYTVYVAHGTPYGVLPAEDGRLVDEAGVFSGTRVEAGLSPDARETEDVCQSGPEGFIRQEDGSVSQFGAASALVARLLEACAAGAI